MPRKHLQHIKSSQANKVPNANDLLYGEIAVNYAPGTEALYIKNSDDEVIAFPNMNIIEENELAIAGGMADLDERLRTLDTATETALTDLTNQNEVTSRALVDLNERINEAYDELTEGIADTNQLVEQISKQGCIEVTYSELVDLINNEELVAGSFYRITDYVTTVSIENARSAGHAFDICVLALDGQTLSENASAMPHEGDTYFAKAKMSAWEIKYTVKNEGRDFEWADTTNGKGVIYYMRDEYLNEASYDFKNIQFKKWKITGVVSDQSGWDNFVDDGNNTVANSLIYTNTNPFYFGSKDIYYDGDTAHEYVAPFKTIIDENEGGSDYFYTFNGIRVSNFEDYHTLGMELEVLQGELEDLLAENPQDASAIAAKEAAITSKQGEIENFVFEYENYDITTDPLVAVNKNVATQKYFVTREIAYDNKIGMCAIDHRDDLQRTMTLPFNVFFGYPNALIQQVGIGITFNFWYDQDHITRITSNVIESDAKNIVFAGSVITNTIKYNAHGCVVGLNGRGNTISEGASNIVFAGNCFGNNVGMGCAVINFGDTSRYCNVGHETYNITFGQYSYDNEIGSYCRWIRYAGNYNNIGDDCYTMTVTGQNNHIGDYAHETTLSNCQYCIVEGVTKTVILQNAYSVKLDSGVTHIELPSNSKLTHVYGGNYTTSDASDVWRTITSNDGYVTNAAYPQCISLTSNTNEKEVVVWNPADLVKQMGDVQTALQNI